MFKFIDAYRGEFTDVDNKIDTTTIGKLFFVSGPKWIDSLFALRNKIIGMMGLKTAGKVSDRERQLQNFTCEPGQQLGLFKVFHKTEHEVILGENDKHLDFRVSLFLEQNTTAPQKQLTISTCVKFNNRFGKLYFIPVKPFHKRIVPVMLKGILHNLNKA